MVGGYIRKTERQNWDGNAMQNAIQAVLNKEMGWLKASKTFGVPCTTLRRRATNANKNVKQSAKGLGRFSATFTPEQERMLVEHIKLLEQRLFGLTCNDLRRLVYDWAEANKIDHRFNRTTKRAGWDWVRGFRKRNLDLSLRKPENTSIARAMAFNKPVIAKFFQVYEEVIDKYKITPEKIYNVDETGVSTVQNPPKIFASKGKKQVGTLAGAERGIHITVVCCTNPIGNYIPPTFIFPRKNWKEGLMEGAPTGSIGFPQESGWMTGELFVKWMCHFQKFSHASKESPVLLVLDGHVSHKNYKVLQYAKENGIILVCLPAHCSHRIQPLDVSFFAPLKTYLNQEVTKKIRSNDGKPISQMQVAKVFCSAYEKAATVENAASGFRNAGLWPINPDIFPVHLFGPSNTTDQPKATDAIQLVTPTVDSSSHEIANVKTAHNAEIENGKEEIMVSLTVLSPIPSTSKTLATKRKKTPTVLTGTPFMEEVKQKEIEKLEKARRQSTRQVKRRLEISPSDAFEEELEFTGEMFENNKDNDDAFCIYCAEPFSRSKAREVWLKCVKCNEWTHAECAGVSPKTKCYICDMCK